MNETDASLPGCWDGNVYAVSAATGEERRRVETGDLVHSSAAVAKETAYVGSRNGNLYALGPNRNEEASGVHGD